MSALIVVGGAILLFVGIALLDRWHKRWAWREAERWAVDQMKLKYGPGWKKPGDRR